MKILEKIRFRLRYRASKEMRTRCGLIVVAATDDAGSHVTIRGDGEDGTHLMSQDMGSYRLAKKLAKRVVSKGTAVYDDWQSPMGLFEVAMLSIKLGNSFAQELGFSDDIA